VPVLPVSSSGRELLVPMKIARALKPSQLPRLTLSLHKGARAAELAANGES
jgi:hypothetical protein